MAIALVTKSVSSTIARGDDLRILATRFRRRGTATDRCDVWMPTSVPAR